MLKKILLLIVLFFVSFLYSGTIQIPGEYAGIKLGMSLEELNKQFNIIKLLKRRGRFNKKSKLVRYAPEVFIKKEGNENIFVNIVSNQVGTIIRRFEVKDKEFFLHKMIQKYGQPTGGAIPHPAKSRKEIEDMIIGKKNRMKRYKKMIADPRLNETEIEIRKRFLTNSWKEKELYKEKISKETNKTELRVLKDTLSLLTNKWIPHWKWEIVHKRIHLAELERRRKNIKKLKKDLSKIYINYEKRSYYWKPAGSKYKLIVSFYHVPAGFLLPEGITENTVEVAIYDPYILSRVWRRAKQKGEK